MIFLEIVMVVIGMAAVIYSFRVSDKPQTENEMTRKAMHIIDMDTMEQMEQQLLDYQQKVEEIASDAEIQTEDRLQSLSNESILGISEYSDQVIDKIEKNHAEVVFLYNMLNEKQDELKEVINDSDKMKAELRDQIAVLYQEHQEWAQKTAGEMQKTTEEFQEMVERCKEEIAESYAAAEPEEIPLEDLDPEVTEILNSVEDLPDDPDSLPPEDTEDVETLEGFNKQEEILDLYKKGHSILEISKLLSIGQGEVGFVIGLYG